MGRPDVISLITETNSAHGVHEAITESVRAVYCTVGSVTRSEYYTALNAGITPEYTFRLALDADYQDEHFLRFHGKRYRVVRTYRTNDGGIEITAERSDENGEAEPESGDDTGNSNG